MNPLLKAWRKLTRPQLIVDRGLKVFLGPVAKTRCANGIYSGKHELPERTVINETLAADDVVLEIGAGVGLVTLLCCQRLGGKRVHSVEANPALLPLLEKSCSLNGFHPELIGGMVGQEQGTQDFFVAPQFVSSSRYAQEGGVQTSVPVIPLAELLARIQPTYLIMDAEGAEADLLDARTDLSCVQKVCVEVHPQIIGDAAINQVIAALKAQGLQLSWTHSRGVVLYFERPALRTVAAIAA